MDLMCLLLPGQQDWFVGQGLHRAISSWHYLLKIYVCPWKTYDGHLATWGLRLGLSAGPDPTCGRRWGVVED